MIGHPNVKVFPCVKSDQKFSCGLCDGVVMVEEDDDDGGGG